MNALAMDFICNRKNADALQLFERKINDKAAKPKIIKEQ